MVGTITQDFVDSPGITLDGELGGSATYAALAARPFGRVAVAGAIGRDRAEEVMRLLEFADMSRLLPFDLPTYSWKARRALVNGDATTLARFTGALEGYLPELGPRESLPRTVFLGSADPELQLAAIEGCPPDAFIGCDTMDIFIEGQRSTVEKVISQCHLLFATQHELEMLAKTRGAAAAALRVLDLFPLVALVVKVGAAGAVLWTANDNRQVPAVEVEVVDPTGAGDALAGAFLGRLSESEAEGEDDLVDALEWGVVAASFAIGGVGVSALSSATREDMAGRLAAYRDGRETPSSG